ncbi:MAG: restriction endonuclease [Desulfuromonadaceae bacterium]|nr:restriction endonuclease [Desulfuromonadaceae bacterium]
MIEAIEPSSWRDLQNVVAQILREAGVTTAVEKTIQTVRGEVSIDVWAHDPTATPTQTYLIECKRWRARVPQTIVHAFRTVVGDSGANWGAIISTAGFQKGALIAAESLNVRLLSWTEFQALFAERWFSHYFVNEIAKETDPLLEYTEPINSRIFRKADLLSEASRQEFRRLRDEHQAIGTLCLLYRAHAIDSLRLVIGKNQPTVMPCLPLRKTVGTFLSAEGVAVADKILDASSYRTLLESIIREAQKAIAQFDELFGERA